MHIGLRPPESLDVRGTRRRWKKFRQKHPNYEIATGISSKDNETRVPTLLAVIGNIATDVFITPTWGEQGDDKKIKEVLLKSEEHCEPKKKNVSYERYKFL